MYADEGKIFYKIAPIEDIYKTFIHLRYKVLNVKLTQKYLSFIVFAYIVNKYDFKISNLKFSIDSKDYINTTLKQYESNNSNIKLLFKNNIHKYKFDIDKLLKSDESINNYITYNLTVNGIELQYKIGIRDIRMALRIKARKYYNLPFKSKYIKDSAIHIRRTIGSNLILVRRKKEPIEETRRFRILESKVVSKTLYTVGKIVTKCRVKKINLFYEKFSSKAEEGVYELCQKCAQSKKTKNFFIIDSNSEDYKRIKEDKKVVKKFSFKYYWLIYNASRFIASEAPSHINILRSNNKYLRKATYDKKFIFLQHGIIYMKNLDANSSFEVGKEGEAEYFIVSSEKEKKVVQQMLGYRPNQLLKTGLAMYSMIDYKHINESSDDIVTVMLTWKPYEEALHNFEKSSYYQNLINIYNILKEFIEPNKIKIVAHPKVYEMLSETDMKDVIWQGPISEILKITKLFITDYSSACYNAFYQGAGVLFYQPDLELYEKLNGKLVPKDDEYIGPRVFNREELVTSLKKFITDGSINLKAIRTIEHEKIYGLINEFSDGKNIDRIYEKLKELKIV